MKFIKEGKNFYGRTMVSSKKKNLNNSIIIYQSYQKMQFIVCIKKSPILHKKNEL